MVEITIHGGMSTAGNLLNAYRQTEENSADSIAVDLIQKSGYSIAGLHEVMKKIEKEERLRIDNLPNYLRSHPLTKDRLSFLKKASENSPRPQKDIEYDLIKAKLFAFLKSPSETRIIYKNDTLADTYALAIADFKETKINQALEKTDLLIKKEPENPYFHELKGQILFETGRIDEAIEAYIIAHELLPKASLIRLSLAQAQLESQTKENRLSAIEHLQAITMQDKYLPDAWYFLYLAYAQNSQFGLADYAKIEYLMRIGKHDEIKKMLPKTKELLANDPIKSNRLADIEEIISKSKSQMQ